MLPRHEVLDIATELTEADERREQAMEDGSGFSHHLAEISLSGYDPDRRPESRLRDFPARTRARTRRSGRSHSEPSDSELDPYWNLPSAGLTPVQAASLRAGAAVIRRIIRERKDAKLTEQGIEPAEMDQHIAVRRADDERRGQRF